MKVFHLQACHRSRKSFVESVRVDNTRLVREEDKAAAFFQHFDNILGSECTPEVLIDFSKLDLPTFIHHSWISASRKLKCGK
jgi:hypothetical protein